MSTLKPLRLDIVSDVVCPWCYIGKRRLESALSEFEHKDEVEIVYHSFQLDPSAPRKVDANAPTVASHLADKYGMTAEQAYQMQEKVSGLAAIEGMAWDHHHSPYVNTVDAHRLLHLALAEYGPQTQIALKESLLDAYFAKALNVADHEVLKQLAVAQGIDPARADAVLASREFEDEVVEDQEQAIAYGANGVPFFVFDDRFGVPGAQDTAVFADVLQKAYAAEHSD